MIFRLTEHIKIECVKHFVPQIYELKLHLFFYESKSVFQLRLKRILLIQKEYQDVSRHLKFICLSSS